MQQAQKLGSRLNRAAAHPQSLSFSSIQADSIVEESTSELRVRTEGRKRSYDIMLPRRTPCRAPLVL